MGAQPVIQNSQGYHNHPVSSAYTQPQANPVYGNPAQQNVQTAAPIPEPAVAQTLAPIHSLKQHLSQHQCHSLLR